MMGIFGALATILKDVAEMKADVKAAKVAAESARDSATQACKMVKSILRDEKLQAHPGRPRAQS